MPNFYNFFHLVFKAGLICYFVLYALEIQKNQPKYYNTLVNNLNFYLSQVWA